MPIEKRDAIQQRGEIFKFLKQSHISPKNIKRLQSLKASADPKIVELAWIVFEVAQIFPFKRKRLQNLARQRRDLLQKLEVTGLIYAHHYCF